MMRIRERISAKRWMAWHALSVERQPAGAIAKTLDMKIATVYAARYQVQQMITQEIQLLNRPDE